MHTCQYMPLHTVRIYVIFPKGLLLLLDHITMFSTLLLSFSLMAFTGAAQAACKFSMPLLKEEIEFYNKEVKELHEALVLRCPEYMEEKRELNLEDLDEKYYCSHLDIMKKQDEFLKDLLIECMAKHQNNSSHPGKSLLIL